MLDIRTPIADLFLVIGALLALYGVQQPSSEYVKCLGYNLDLLWGGAMLLFGAAMTMWKFLGSRPTRAEAQAKIPAAADPVAEPREA
ncbi:MAG: hypothetical protein KGR26_02800 [Cyanobacteria bacterium REEB65]|nr:hypothetical protein [Cyanobacteria bacterium REEB65]